MKTVLEEVLKWHNTSFEIRVENFWNFITSENEVVLNSYLVGIAVSKIESFRTIYKVMWIIDIL